MYTAQDNMVLSAVPPTRWVPDGPWPSILMFAGVAALFTTFAAILILPLPVAILMSCVMYALLIITELRNYIVSPMNISILSMYLLLIVAVLSGQVEDWLPYTGSLFLGVLFLVSFILLLLGHPFTTFYEVSGKGLLLKHWVISSIWTLAYLVGAVLGVVLMPDVMFIIAPLLVMLIAAIIMLVFNLVWFGGAAYREQDFVYEGFRFTQIGNDADSLDKCYELAATEFWPAIRSSRGRKVTSIKALAERLRRVDILHADRVVRFIAWKDGQAVGTIYCILDGLGGLPVETQSGVNFNYLRSLGAIMEIGNFAIVAAYRTKPALFIGLMRCAVDVAMEHGVSFIVNDSFASQSGIYRKIGFHVLGTEFAGPDGTPCLPLGLNLSTSIVYTHRWEKDSFVNRLAPLLNAYLAERSYHWLVLTNFWRYRYRRSYELKLESLADFKQGHPT